MGSPWHTLGGCPSTYSIDSLSLTFIPAKFFIVKTGSGIYPSCISLYPANPDSDRNGQGQANDAGGIVITTFIIKRFFTSILAVVGATIIIFAASRVLGDPTVLLLPEEGYGLDSAELEKARQRLHLDKPVPLQYAFWVGDLLQGDLGQDLGDRHPISSKLKDKLPPTLRLAIGSYILATLIGIPLGILSAVKRGSVWDMVGRIFALLGQSLPAFWIAILAILVFAVWLEWLPAGTQGEGFSIKNYILPTLTLAWLPAAGYLRLMRSSMLEVLDSEYVKLARAKGVGVNTVIWKHAFKNAFIAPLTFSGLVLTGFITGSVSVEVVFGWPGIARLAVESVFTNNLTTLSVITLIFTLIYVVANFIVDIIYGVIDPRIRYS